MTLLPMMILLAQGAVALVNPNFSAELEGWQVPAAEGVTVEVVQDQGHPALRVAVADTVPRGWWIVSQSFPASPGEEWLGEADVRPVAVRNGAGAYLTIEYLGADGAIITEEGFGNPDTDLIMNCVKLESRGIKTVLITDEYAGRDGSSQSLADASPKADAVVSAANANEVIVLPPMDRVIGYANAGITLVGVTLLFSLRRQAVNVLGLAFALNLFSTAVVWIKTDPVAVTSPTGLLAQALGLGTFGLVVFYAWRLNKRGTLT